MGRHASPGRWNGSSFVHKGPSIFDDGESDLLSGSSRPQRPGRFGPDTLPPGQGDHRIDDDLLDVLALAKLIKVCYSIYCRVGQVAMRPRQQSEQNALRLKGRSAPLPPMPNILPTPTQPCPFPTRPDSPAPPPKYSTVYLQIVHKSCR